MKNICKKKENIATPHGLTYPSYVKYKRRPTKHANYTLATSDNAPNDQALTQQRASQVSAKAAAEMHD